MAARLTLSATPPSLPASDINASDAQAVPGATALSVSDATPAAAAVQQGHAQVVGQSSLAQVHARLRELAKAPANAELPQAAHAAPQADESAAARAGKSASGHTTGHTALQSAALELLTADNECSIQTFTGRNRAEASSVFIPRHHTNPYPLYPCTPRLDLDPL